MLMYKCISLTLLLVASSCNCLMEQQPIFTSQPADIGPLFSGTRGILQCTASGTPPVHYRWLKDGRDLTPRNTTASSSNSGGGGGGTSGAYLISQADRHRHVGSYQCIAENKLGAVLSNRAQLTVAYMDQVRSAHYRTEIRVRRGRAALIRMPRMFDAYPAPTVEWFAGGALIEPNAKFAITKDSHLVVLRCEKPDEKTYYVEASSVHTGTRIRSREMRLHVVDSSSSRRRLSASSSHRLDMDDENSDGGDDDGHDDDDDVGDDGGGSFYDLMRKSQDDDDQDAQDSARLEPAELEFVVRPSDTVAKLNDNLVKFDCIVNSRQLPLDQIEIVWFKDGQLIDFLTSKYHMSSRALEIISVSDQDAGLYTCLAKCPNHMASNDHNQQPQHPHASSSNNVSYWTTTTTATSACSVNASARLDVHIKPAFLIQPESVIETDLGTSIQLRCDGIATPPPAITWYKNAQLVDLVSSGNIELNDSNTRLVIHNVAPSDEAVYQCFLSNQVGHVSASTLVKIVSFAPRFVQPVRNHTVFSQSSATLSCGQVDASPKPHIVWRRLSPSANSMINGAQAASSDAHFNHNARLNWHRRPHQYASSNIKNNNDDESNFDFSPIMEKKSSDSSTSGENNNDDLSMMTPSGTDKQQEQMYVENVGVSDEGWYECEASNLLGRISARLYLTVRRRTRILDAPQNTSVTKGQSATLTCLVDKEEDVNVDLRWFFNDVLIDLPTWSPTSSVSSFSMSAFNYQSMFDTQANLSSSSSGGGGISGIVSDMNDNVRIFANGSLQIVEAKNTDIGVYKCVVRSLNGGGEAGNDTRLAYVNVVELPYAPVNVRASLVSARPRTVNVSWSLAFDGNSPLIKHSVYARLSFASSSSSSSSYSFLLDAQSSPLDWFLIRDNVMLDSPSQSPQSSSSSLSSSSSPARRWTLVSDLRPAMTYEFRVVAHNAIGPGMASRSSNNVTIGEEAPSEPPAHVRLEALDARTIRVSWQAPPAATWNGRLRGYRLAYALSYPNATTWRHVSVSSDRLEHNLTDLIVWETYVVRVCAFNSLGLGVWSETRSVRTREGVPIRAPLAFRASALNSTCVRMWWTEPPAQFLNGLVLGYKLLMRHEHAPPRSPDIVHTISLSGIQSGVVQSSVSVASNSNNNNNNNNNMNNNNRVQFEYQLCGMLKFTSYTLSVLAFTSAGDGPPTQPIQLKTYEDVPGGVLSLSFDNVYDTSVDVLWQAPQQPNGRIVAYILTCVELGAKQSVPAAVFTIELPHSNNYTLRSLRSSTEYAVSVRARTAVGDGAERRATVRTGVPAELPESPQLVVVRGPASSRSCELEFIPGYAGRTTIRQWIVQAVELSAYEAQLFSIATSPSSPSSSSALALDPPMIELLDWRLLDTISNAPNATRLVVANLRPHRNYTLRMYARNVKGTSVRASPPTHIFATAGEVPSAAPEHITARLARLYATAANTSANGGGGGGAEMLVKWTPLASDEWNGEPRAYLISIVSCDTDSDNHSNNKFNRTIHVPYAKFMNNYRVVRGLPAYACLRVRMCARNAIGTGRWSPSALVVNRTSQSRPLASPLTIHLYSLNASTIGVSWSSRQAQTQTLDANGPLVAYKIRYEPIDQDAQTTKPSRRNDTSGESKYYNLYNYRSSSQSTTSSSSSSSSSSDSTNECDSEQWLQSARRARELLVAASDEDAQLANLLADTTYKVEMSACTRAGCAPSSLPVSLRTSGHVPSRPVHVRFSHVNATSVRVEWRPPLCANGRLHSYRVRYILKRYLLDTNTNTNNKKDDQFQWSTATYVNASSTTATRLDVAGLVKHEVYVFEVSVNSTLRSAGVWSAPARALVFTSANEPHRRTPPPTPVDKPSVSVIGSGAASRSSPEIVVSWTSSVSSANEDDDAPIRAYVIQLRELRHSFAPPAGSSGVRSLRALDAYVNANWSTTLSPPPGDLPYRPSMFDDDERQTDRQEEEEEEDAWHTVYKVHTSSVSSEAATSSSPSSYQVTIRGRDKRGSLMLKPNGRVYQVRVACENDAGMSGFGPASLPFRTRRERPARPLLAFNVRMLDAERMALDWLELVQVRRAVHTTSKTTTTNLDWYALSALNDHLTSFRIVYRRVDNMIRVYRETPAATQKDTTIGQHQQQQQQHQVANNSSSLFKQQQQQSYDDEQEEENEDEDETKDDDEEQASSRMGEVFVDYAKTSKVLIEDEASFLDYSSTKHRSVDEEESSIDWSTQALVAHSYVLDTAGIVHSSVDHEEDHEQKDKETTSRLTAITYEWSVCGVNEAGSQSRAQCSLAAHLLYSSDRTPGAYPIGPEESASEHTRVSVDALSGTQLNVSWSRPSERVVNGRLYAYKLVYFASEFFDDMIVAETALNARIQHPWSTSKLTQQQQRQKRLEEPTVDNDDDDDDDDETSALERNELVGVHVVQAYFSASSANTAILADLQPYTNYTVHIQLLNEHGDESLLNISSSAAGGWQTTLSARTLESIPEQPARLAFSHVAFSSLNVTWRRPARTNGRLLAYELWYENIDSSNATTKIIRQEMTHALDADNHTLYIDGLAEREPTEYRFRLRCRTRVGWSMFVEARVRTGWQANGPPAPLKPLYTDLNDTHALLEWRHSDLQQQQQRDKQQQQQQQLFFLVEVKFITLVNNESNASNKNAMAHAKFGASRLVVGNEYSVFERTDLTRIVINKYDRRLNQQISVHRNGAQQQQQQKQAQQPQASNHKTSDTSSPLSSSSSSSRRFVNVLMPSSTLCLFRVVGFDWRGLGQPSAATDLVHIRRTTANTLLFMEREAAAAAAAAAAATSASSQAIASSNNGGASASSMSASSSSLSSSGSSSSSVVSAIVTTQSPFYSNWWFLVIVGLATLIIIVLLILVMFLRGNNNKFLLEKKKRVNTLRMMKMNAAAAAASGSTGSTGTMLDRRDRTLVRDGSIFGGDQSPLTNLNSTYLTTTNAMVSGNTAAAGGDNTLNGNENVYVTSLPMPLPPASVATLVMTRGRHGTSLARTLQGGGGAERGGTIVQQQPAYNLYDVRRSTRGGGGGLACLRSSTTSSTTNMYGTMASGGNDTSTDNDCSNTTLTTIAPRTGTYVSPNGTLSRLTIVGSNDARSNTNTIQLTPSQMHVQKSNDYLIASRVVSNGGANSSLANLNHYLVSPISPSSQQQQYSNTATSSTRCANQAVMEDIDSASKINFGYLLSANESQHTIATQRHTQTTQTNNNVNANQHESQISLLEDDNSRRPFMACSFGRSQLYDTSSSASIQYATSDRLNSIRTNKPAANRNECDRTAGDHSAQRVLNAYCDHTQVSNTISKLAHERVDGTIANTNMVFSTAQHKNNNNASTLTATTPSESTAQLLNNSTQEVPSDNSDQSASTVSCGPISSVEPTSPLIQNGAVSIRLSGDRILMNNTAGSRRPLTSFTYFS